ncbi:hypothetical protein [Marinobacter caseinilyticus]|uniref:hypothetical protein n=1 Tax=Marinobacter caseinilyticus TaxID=2692195 RepID=UPI00140B1BD4|nr:hypothetical protein [Marinobacter caseinilyticus]
MTKARKATNQKQFLLRRRLTVEGLTESQWEDVVQQLNHHSCVDHAERKPGHRLLVSIDGSHFSTDRLMDLIRARGGHVTGGWWQRRKIAWYRFTDDNVRANANLEPFCCSRIPPVKK